MKPDKGLIFIFHFNFYFDIYIFEFWGIYNYWVILQIVNRRVLGQSIINFTSSDYINYSAFQKNNYMWFTLKSVHKESSLVSKDISAFKIKTSFLHSKNVNIIYIHCENKIRQRLWKTLETDASTNISTKQRYKPVRGRNNFNQQIDCDNYIKRSGHIFYYSWQILLYWTNI